VSYIPFGLVHSAETISNWIGMIFIYLGVCALATKASVLAYPDGDTGSVSLYDCDNTCYIKTRINAHTSPISSLGLNETGDLLSTASTSGTVIRVFSRATNYSKPQELRRGSYAASVISLTFSIDSSYLVVSSDKATIHIFRVNVQPQPYGLILFLIIGYVTCEKY
jgi:WD repeat-containing protein 45